MKPVSLLFRAGCLAASLLAAWPSYAATPTPAALSRTPILNELGLGPAITWVQGEPAILFNAPDKHVTFERGNHRVTLDLEAPVVGGQFFKLVSDGATVMAMWWSHENAKALYFARSTDGGKTFSKPAVVNDGSGVLPPYHLASADNNLGMVYLDERSPKYEIYFNRSEDGGLSWNRPDTRLDNPPVNKDADSERFEPQMASIGSRWVVVWRDPGHESMGQFNYQSLLMRTSTDAGKTWSQEQHIYSTKQIMSQLTLKAIDNHFVLAFAEGNSLRVMTAPADAAKWSQPLPVQGFDASSAGDIKIAATAADKFTVVWSANVGQAKAAIYASGFDLTKNAWLHDTVRVDAKPVENTQSLSPSLATLPDGTAVAAWTDFRNIMPEIYVATSKDHGVSWSTPQNIGINGADFMTSPTLIVNHDALTLGYQMYVNSDRSELVYATLPIHVDAKGLITGLPKQTHVSDEERLKLLKERVMALWDLRQKADFSATYSFFDPAFRAAISQKLFDNSQAQIVYQDVKWSDAVIQGNVAQTKVTLKLKVMPMEIKGKKIDLPEQNSVVNATWLWIKDNWYLQYKGIQNQTYISY
jgi:hypothetical protein